MLSAFPVNINGFVTPRPIHQLNKAGVEDMRALFGKIDWWLSQADIPANVLLNPTPQKMMRHISPWIYEACLKHMDEYAQCLSSTLQPLACELQALQALGGTVLDGSFSVNYKVMESNEEHIGSSDYFHVDPPNGMRKIAREWQENGIIHLRTLMASDNPFYVCDLSDVKRASNILMYARPDEKGGVTAAVNDGLIGQGTVFRAKAGETIFMNMVNPHCATRTTKSGPRFLVDNRARVKLPTEVHQRIMKANLLRLEIA